jgi:hypothetical protein
MKTRGLQGTDRGRQRALDHRGARTDKSPPVAGEYSYPEPALCRECGAVYARKTWRRSEQRRLGAYLCGSARVLCPACLQVGEGRAYGRVLLLGSWLADHEAEVRRRISTVEARARYTQPERRLLTIARRDGGLEVTTTSQKLAHRVARELEKAFGGRAAYAWSDRDGALMATLSNPGPPAGHRAHATARRRPKQ